MFGVTGLDHLVEVLVLLLGALSTKGTKRSARFLLGIWPVSPLKCLSIGMPGCCNTALPSHSASILAVFWRKEEIRPDLTLLAAGFFPRRLAILANIVF